MFFNSFWITDITNQIWVYHRVTWLLVSPSIQRALGILNVLAKEMTNIWIEQLHPFFLTCYQRQFQWQEQVSIISVSQKRTIPNERTLCSKIFDVSSQPVNHLERKVRQTNHLSIRSVHQWFPLYQFSHSNSFFAEVPWCCKSQKMSDCLFFFFWFCLLKIFQVRKLNIEALEHADMSCLFFHSGHLKELALRFYKTNLALRILNCHLSSKAWYYLIISQM